MDIFIIVSICFIVFFLILPEVFEVIGWWSIFILVIGSLLPLISEYSGRLFSFTYKTISILIILSLMTHSFFDGAAIPILLLQKKALLNIYPVLLLLIIHKLPVGLFICRMFKNKILFAIILLALLAFISVVGYIIASKMEFEFQYKALAYFNSFVAGLILHVVFHNFHTNGHKHVE